MRFDAVQLKKLPAEGYGAVITVLGESGGGPYALACAYELGDRVDCVAVVGGLGPVARPGATTGIARVPEADRLSVRGW